MSSHTTSKLREDIEATKLAKNEPYTYAYLNDLADVLDANSANNIALSSNVTDRIYEIKDKFNDKIEGINNLNKRKLEIEHFYILKYKKEIQLLQQIIIICSIGLVGCFIYSMGLMSNNMLSLYLGFVLAVGFVFVFYRLWDIFIRDNEVFDEYDYGIYGSKPAENVDMTTDTKGKVKHNLSNLKC